MKNEKSKIWLRIIVLIISCAFFPSCGSSDDYFLGKYELNIPSKDSACLVEFQEGGKGYLSCDGPIQINWLVVEGNVILIEGRQFNLIFDPIEYDTTWTSINVLKWQSRNDIGVTLKLKE
jgi:hypothetical protein